MKTALFENNKIKYLPKVTFNMSLGDFIKNNKDLIDYLDEKLDIMDIEFSCKLLWKHFVCLANRIRKKSTFDIKTLSNKEWAEIFMDLGHANGRYYMPVFSPKDGKYLLFLID